IRQANNPCYIIENRRHPIDVGLRIDPNFLRRLLYLLPVLVPARQEEYVEPVQPLPPCHHVGRDRGVGVPDMWLAIHIIDRRRDVIPFGHDIFPLSSPSPATIAWRLSRAKRSVSSCSRVSACHTSPQASRGRNATSRDCAGRARPRTTSRTADAIPVRRRSMKLENAFSPRDSVSATA